MTVQTQSTEVLYVAIGRAVPSHLPAQEAENKRGVKQFKEAAPEAKKSPDAVR
jgi:hypothetical protein